MTVSTSKPPAKKSIAASIASLPQSEIDQFIDGLSDNALKALPYLFDIWAFPDHQLPPAKPWRTWLILGGRGAGKTRAGAEWVRMRVEGATALAAGLSRRVALVGASLAEVRDVMVMGESGIIACSPKDRRPTWNAARWRLVWPNGAEATCYSGASPERLRGPQFDAAWSDELAKWAKPSATWDNLQLALRLGAAPQQVVTTTPRATTTLERLIDQPSTKIVSAPTLVNAANLATRFLEEMETAIVDPDKRREELQGEMVLDRAGALWSRDVLSRSRAAEAPALDRIVVAVDPPATSGETADECGVIVAGRSGDPAVAYVLADLTSAGETPNQWAARVVRAYHEYEADRIVAEVNQGGEMVEALVRGVDPDVAFTAVRATRSKRTRAEPVSALYEQGRVRHVGAFPALEDQMRGFGGDGGGASPDRVDALVWAVTALILSEPRGPAKVRVL